MGTHAAAYPTNLLQLPRRIEATDFGMFLVSQALEQLSAADNRLTELPAECTGLASLRSLSLCVFVGYNPPA